MLQDYTRLRTDTQGKNIIAWTPVVAEIMEGFCRFDDKAVSMLPYGVDTLLMCIQFARYLPAIFPLATELLGKEIAPEVRQPLRTYFVRVGIAQGILEVSP